MAQRRWWVLVPFLCCVGLGARVLQPAVTRGADRRIVNEQFLALEAQLGHHLYAPTWLPRGGTIGPLGAMQGVKRILQDFNDSEGRALCILSQERRTPERDRYHMRLFRDRAEARAEVNGKPAYFVTGSGGERRLFWNEPDMAVILSSCVLSDQELLEIARRVR